MIQPSDTLTITRSVCRSHSTFLGLPKSLLSSNLDLPTLIQLSSSTLPVVKFAPRLDLGETFSSKRRDLTLVQNPLTGAG